MNFYYDGNRYDEREVNYNPDGTISSVTYRRRGKVDLIIGGIGFIMMGLFIIVTTINNEINYNKKNETFIETTATIVDFESREHICSSEESCTGSYMEYAPILEYKIDVNTYRYKYNYVREEPTINDTIDIKYNPSNYNDIIIKNHSYPTMPVVSFGILFMFVGIVLIFIGYRNIRKQQSKRNEQIQSQNNVINNSN